MDSPERLAALVLAGGYSSRMGCFKPLLTLHGATLVAHAASTFSGLVRAVRVVVGHRGEALLEEVHRQRALPVVNAQFAQGMFTSVQAGLRALPSDSEACFILPVDIPAVRPHTAAALAAVYRRTGADVVHPRFRGVRGHPPLISARLFPAILQGGDGGLRRILEAHERGAVDVDLLDEGVRFDLDTPADLQRAQDVPQGRTVPTAEETAALAYGLAMPEPVRRHSAAVATVAARLADALGASGVALDRSLVAAAALLHDVAKGTPQHARAGAQLLRRLGYPRVASVVARHMDLSLAAVEPASEAALVYLADKLVRGERLIDLAERERATLAAHGHSEAAREAIARRFAHARLVAQAVHETTGHDALELACGPSSARAEEVSA